MTALVLLPRFRKLDEQLRSFEDRESWSADEISHFQLGRLNQIWNQAKCNVPYYKSLGSRLPAQFDSLSQFSELVPVLPKQVVRNNPEQFFSRKASRGSWYRTGGSTGNPMKIYWGRDAHHEVLRAKYRSEQAHGLEVFDKKVFLWGHEGSFAPGIAGRFQRIARPVHDRLRNRKRISAYDLSDERLLSNLKMMERFAPRSLYGYSSAISLMADVANGTQFDLPSLRVAIMTAEPADSFMRQQVADQLGCTAVIEYGAMECGLMAYSMPDGTLRTRDDIVLVETIRNQHGLYDIVVSVLNNHSFPLLRYRIEDTTSQPRRRPDRGFGILQDVQGRSNDLLISKSGKKLHSMAVKHTLECWPSVRRFTAYQRSTGELAVTIESSDAFPASLGEMLKRQLVELLDGYPVTMETVQTLPGNLAGKHRWIISELAAAELAE